MAETTAMGHTARLSLEPEQLPIINAAPSPSENDLAWAQRTVAELGEDGAHVSDGSDLPKLARAKKLLHLGTLFYLTPPPHPGAAERCSS
ncbi:hypothetical protein [Rhodococcus koreensis]|uniref:hypothetical protein n=1 Tax=Rhodococcus koreensis TaxID=99653 RepID=UPI00366E6BE8